MSSQINDLNPRMKCSTVTCGALWAVQGLHEQICHQKHAKSPQRVLGVQGLLQWQHEAGDVVPNVGPLVLYNTTNKKYVSNLVTQKEKKKPPRSATAKARTGKEQPMLSFPAGWLWNALG